MRPVLALSRVAVIACLTIGAAACSSARFTDRPPSNQYASQSPASTAPAYSAPAARVDTQTLPPTEPLPSPQATAPPVPPPRPF